jgi:hypothetical protein
LVSREDQNLEGFLSKSFYNVGSGTDPRLYSGLSESIEIDELFDKLSYIESFDSSQFYSFITYNGIFCSELDYMYCKG